MTTSTAESIENTINQALDDILERHPNITDKHSKTAGIGLYVGDRKFLQISENTRDRIEFLILRDPDKDYCRPQYGDLDIRNIRKYDPTQASYIRPWGYMFYKVLVTTEQYLDNKNVFDQLIDKSYDIANEEKILKVSKTEHEQLEPIFEGTYIFEENDEVETSTEETSDTDVEHSDPEREEIEEVEAEENDEPLSVEILSEDEAEEVESKEVSSVDEKEVVADETDPDRRVFNYINKDPEKTISILDKIEIALFLELVKKDDIARLESLYILLSKYEIPEEYVFDFIEDRMSIDNFKKLINIAAAYHEDTTEWPQFDFVMDCYKAFNNNIENAINELKSVETISFPNDKWGIKTKRLLELLQYPMTPILDMTMDEAEIIYGSPSSDKEDVMKTKTVVTWTYLKPSNKIDRDIEALELKFRDDKLERYIDKRDKTNWSHELEYISHSPYQPSSTMIDILYLFITMKSLFEDEINNKYSVNNIINKTVNLLDRCEADIKEKIKYYRDLDDLKKYYKKPVITNMIKYRQTLLDNINTWNNDLYPLPKFDNAKKKFEDVKNRDDISKSINNLQSSINKGNAALEGKSGCFIATATMGDINHPTVLHLREFRDLFLLKRSWGASFIRYYYHYGPYPARIIAKSRILKFASYLIIIKPLTIITKWLLQSKNN